MTWTHNGPTWARKAGERLGAMHSDEAAVSAAVALLHWMRGDACLRPWRLTRRQRVEMEAALACLRFPTAPNRWPLVSHVTEAAELLGGDARSAVPQWIDVGTNARRDAWRILRARVAIALRAALRSDEDARCEEANARFAVDESETLREMCGWRETRRAFRYDRRTLDEIALLPLSVWTWASWSKAESARGVNESGERLYAICIESTVPLALWERAR